MHFASTVADLRTLLAPMRAEGKSIGFVPTMGALHAGHASLIERSAAACDTTVVSIFVNPLQFNEQRDLAAYPRTLERDTELARGAGATVLFAPSPDAMYPAGFDTTVIVRGTTEMLEGAVRGTAHFDGVTTVVAKLFNMVQPHVAYFGQKDAQQLAVVRQMVRDLAMPVRIEGCPIVREADGLAMSSRNVRLGGPDRARAVALVRGLDAAQAEVDRGERRATVLVAAARARMAEFAVESEYCELVSPDSLQPIETMADAALLLVAARIGEVRLIDNALLTVSAVPPHAPHAAHSSNVDGSGA